MSQTFISLIEAAKGGPAIRLDRFANENWPTRIEHLSISECDRIFTPWYMTDADIETNWADPLGRPISVQVAVRVFDRLSHRDRFKYPIEQLGAGVPFPRLLPAYQLPDDRFLLLDGNHRLVAACFLQIQCEIALMVCDGPLEESALPDLRHWARA